MTRPNSLYLLNLFLTFAALCLATPPWWERYSGVQRVIVPQSYYEVLKMRVNMELNPRAVTDVSCIDRNAHIIYHDENVAELAICGGMRGSVGHCRGKPSTTEGRSGTALFTVTAMDPGAAITISKARWEECVRAARDACPTGSLRATCLGGATSGNLVFILSNA